MPHQGDLHDNRSSHSPVAVMGNHAAKDWPWEGAVQNVFAEALVRGGWTVDQLTDTASRAHGIDVLAHCESRRLAAEVKGFPSDRYQRGPKAGQPKPTSVNGQAKIWFGKAVLAALILHDSEPDWDSLVVVPDVPRYCQLAEATARSLGSVPVHVVLMRPDGTYDSPTWRLGR